jgi:hypothetical protein
MTDGSTYFAVTMLAVVGLVVLYVWLAIGLAGVFRKSGEESWQAWVPILNLVVLLRLGGLSGWLLLLWLVPGLGFIAVWVVVVIACHRVNAAFGFGAGMTVLAALLLPVWASVIGFGTARWVGAEAQPGARRTAAPIDDDGPAFIAAMSEPETRTPARGYGRTGDIPPQPPLPAAPSTGWTPPPLPTAVPPAPATTALQPAPPTTAAPTAASTPPPMPSMPVAAAHAAPVDRWQGLEDVDEFTGEVTGAFTGAPAPVSAVPIVSVPRSAEAPPGPQRGGSPAPASAASAVDAPVSAVPAAPVAAPAPEPWAPKRSPMADPDAMLETSGSVSAIVGAPVAGMPRAARGSVNASFDQPQIPQDAMEQTIIAHRRRTTWSIVPPSGAPISLTADTVILGRRPVADPEFPGAQLVAIQDGTVSKTHARLELRDDTWYITDLDSTNGVLFATLMGTEVEATPGVEVEAGDRFLLGDAEVRLLRSEG